MAGIKNGQFYVYRDEDGHAVAIAMMTRGPNGGRMGVDYARMGVPYGKTTREDINNRAEFMVAAMNSFGNTKAVINAKDAEIAKLREALKSALSYVERAETGDNRSMADILVPHIVRAALEEQADA